MEDAGAWDFTSGWDATDPMAVCELWSYLEMTKPAWVVSSYVTAMWKAVEAPDLDTAE